MVWEDHAIVNLTGALNRLAGNTSLPTGRQAKPCNAGFVDMEWVIEDLTKSELQQCLMNVVLRIQKAPLQGFSSVPAESVLAVFCNVKVNPSRFLSISTFQGNPMLKNKIVQHL